MNTNSSSSFFFFLDEEMQYCQLITNYSKTFISKLYVIQPTLMGDSVKERVINKEAVSL